MSDQSTPPAEQVPAFESSLGLGDAEAPVMVDKAALEHFNKDMATNGRHTLANHVEAANIAALFSKRAIRPDEIAGLRREMFRVVTKGLKEVEQVLDGKKAWSASQVRLFSVLTERVMPKLSTIAVEDNTAKKLDEMSVEELEAIALGKRKHEAIDVVAKEASRLDQVADRAERRNASAEIKRGLAHVVGLDEAEKRYIARKSTRYSLREEEERTLKVLAKPQPQPTDGQMSRLRASRQGGLRGMLERKGYTPEQIEQAIKQKVERTAKTKEHTKTMSQIREARKMGLGDAHAVPEDISKSRQAILREFRLPPNKGVRRQTSILREQQRKQAQEAREKERRENPRLFVKGVGGIPEEVEKRGLRLRDLRQHRPDLFVEPEGGK